MKKVIYLSFLLLILISCSKKEKDLKLELLTNQIFCVENIGRNQFLENFYIPNKEYDRLSKNILNYRITNVSDKKYYIMLNENTIGTLERDDYKEAKGMKKSEVANSVSFSLYKNDLLLNGGSTIAEMGCGTLYLIKAHHDETFITNFLMKNKLDKTYGIKLIDSTDYSLQGYFLQPGETKYFTSIVNLPYRDNQKWLTNIDSLKPNLGSISLRNDSIYTRSIISKNRKKEIKENGYVLFDGIIYSNKVPVKLITVKNSTKN